MTIRYLVTSDASERAWPVGASDRVRTERSEDERGKVIDD